LITCIWAVAAPAVAKAATSMAASVDIRDNIRLNGQPLSSRPQGPDHLRRIVAVDSRPDQ
jgi:hypothetical protein